MLFISLIKSILFQVTGDSLFNLPASLMAKMWSKNGKAFFYSFEQKPNKNKHGGPEFLQGLPIVENLNNTNNGKINIHLNYNKTSLN